MALGLSLSDDEVVLVKTQKAPVQYQSKPDEAPPQRHLITDKAERRHAKSCDRTACPRCLVASKPKWLERDTHISNGLDASVLANLSGHHLALANASWCQARCSPSGDDWWLGCIACANLTPKRTIGTMARVWAQYEACQNSLANWQLQRHARSQVHQQAVLHLLGVAVGPTGGCLSGAPTMDSFRILLSRMGRREKVNVPLPGASPVPSAPAKSGTCAGPSLRRSGKRTGSSCARPPPSSSCGTSARPGYW